MVGLFKSVLGNGDEREVKRLLRVVRKINSLEPNFEAMGDEELTAQTERLKERHAGGTSLDELLPEAFAIVREASKRVLGMRHFDVQLLGGMVLHQGRVAEMRTGEGKTLVATLPVYLNAIAGKGVHVVTVNDYLARRDSEWMGKVYGFLGLTVGLNVHGLSHTEKQDAYRADVTYGTNNEFGFDYLRDNMVMEIQEMVQRPLHYAIVDEVDSILVDEARTPLIISGPAEKSTDLYFMADLFVRSLRHPDDYSFDEKTRTANLTDDGVHKAERYFRVPNLFDPNHITIHHHITQALKAHSLMRRDKDYVVQAEEVVIVDEFTGRLMQGRRYSDGLHQAIEAKEGVKVQNESRTLATITLQNYFRMYKKLSGMTGTAKTEEREFVEIYGMDVVAIPPNKPNQRADQSDVVYRSERGKFTAVVQEIVTRHEVGQPVLVGTTSIEKSEVLSDMLRGDRVSHQVLNAKQHEREAEIISHAGERGMVTIATNMAGRGTDIILGPGVTELGGLHIIGTERHESRRIDNQLRGRSGRQGDPGSSQFFLSLEDDLMRLFGSENIMGVMDKIGIEEDQPIENRMVTKAIERAQKKVEANNYDIRKHVLKYDDVMNKQREVIYRQRMQILKQDHLRDIVKGMVHDIVDFAISTYCLQEQIPEDWDLKGLMEYLDHVFLAPERVLEEELRKLDREELRAHLYDQIEVEYTAREEELGDFARELERIVLLRTVDNKWMDHIDAMETLRQGIHLRAYGQKDPLTEYQQEGYEMFLEMIHGIQEEVATYMFKSQVSLQEQPPETPQPLYTST